MSTGEPTNKIVVFITAPQGEPGVKLARALVEERLAACVNILPDVRSIYSWKGELCDDGEILLVVKTRASLFEKLRERVSSLHPHEVPEVIALPLVAGHPPYLDWVEEMTLTPN